MTPDRSNRYSRRALLKALGLGMAILPLLDSEPVAAGAAGVAKRFISITWTNGIVPEDFYPAAGPLTAPLPAILSPLEPWKSKVLAMRGPGPAVCSPGVRFCTSNSVYSCSQDGTSQSAVQDCGSFQHCIAMNNWAFCDDLLCTPGQPSCNGNTLATCNADGSDWLPGGQDCSLTSGVCVDAQCKAAVCVSGEQFCKNGNVQQCNDGLSYSQVQFCAQGTSCLKHGNGTDCAPTPCQPDTVACAAEKLGQCATDGMSVATSTDCGSQNKVCTLAGCAATAVDTVSAATQIGTASSGEVLGNIVLVHSARKLTTIEADLSMPQPHTLIWVVYEETNADLNGEFDLKFQKSTTGSGSGAGFQSSGPISVELEAGKSYYIGVSSSDGSFAHYYDYLTAAPSINFAHVIGAFDTGFGPSFDYPNQAISLAYHQRLSTTPP